MGAALKQVIPIDLRDRKDKDPGLYWHTTDDPNMHLGYRRAAKRDAGVWLVRWRQKDGGYKQAKLSTPDGVATDDTHSFWEAIKLAEARVEAERARALAQADGEVLTVQSAVETYVAMRDARDSMKAGRAVRSDASQRLGRYVIGAPKRGRQDPIPPSKLAKIELHQLTEAHLREWLAGLPRRRLPMSDGVGQPKGLKHATLDRLSGDLKAALNNAYDAHRERLNPRLPDIIKNGLRLKGEADPVARENQILSDGDVARLLVAAREIDKEQGWEGDLFRLIVVMTATGARFSQVARMRVADLQLKAGRLIVPMSHKGKGAKSGTMTIPVDQDVLDELAVATQGRVATAPLLERWRHAQTPGGGMAWVRTERGAWLASSEMARPWQAIRERAGLPNVIPYALRHTSIVRGISANLPIRLVAAMHDTSVAMIEAHYSRWIVDGLEDLARAAVRPLIPQSNAANVVRLK